MRPGGQVARSLGAGGIVPSSKQLDLRLGKTSIPHELAGRTIGQPRRHITLFRDFRDLTSSLFDVVIAEQRKWSRFARPMARRAVLKHNGRNILVETNWRS